MTTRTIAIIAASIAAAAFIGSAGAAEPTTSQQVQITGHLQPADNAAYQRYRAVVLGNDVGYTAAPIIDRSGTGFVPGSYARYLMRNGATRSDALARAGNLGETQVYQVVNMQPQQLDARQLNEKRLGNLPLVPASATTIASAQ